MKTSSFQVDGLITGKIRDAQVFLQVMSMMIRLRDKGVFRRIIFSGWHEDMLSLGDLVINLKNNGVTVVDNGNSLPIKSCGHYWEQVKTLQGGLEQIEDGVLFFKTRTDILFYGGDETVAEIVVSNQGFPCHSFGIKHKIWIPSFVALQPFFMADQCFLGLTDDFRRFLRFDADVEAQDINVPFYPGSKTHPAAASAEIRFWLQPFLDKFEALWSYRKIWPHSMNGHPQYPQIQAFHMNSPIYQEYLSIYWSILNASFRVSEGKFCIVNGLDTDGKYIVRANAHSNNSLSFMNDALNLLTPYPVSFSTDLGLKKLLETGEDQFRHLIYEPAYQRATSFKLTPERMKSFQIYVNDLISIAYSKNHLSEPL